MPRAKQLFFRMLVTIGIVASTAAPSASAMSQTEPSIIFTSNRGGSTEIYASKRNGTDMRQLTHNNIDEQTPAISPNGSSIAFITSDEASTDSTLSLLNTSTGAVTTLSHWTNTQYNSPVWSPDGKSIAFSFTSAADEFSSCIAIYKVAEGIINKISCSDTSLASPSWSPNGQKLLFTQYNSASGGDLYTVNTVGNEDKQLLRSGFSGVFSPTGDKIAYTAWDKNFTNQIFVANSDGSNPTQITDGSDLHTVADWTSDGYITYTNVTSGVWHIQVKSIRSDGSGELTIPQDTPNTVDWPGRGIL